MHALPNLIIDNNIIILKLIFYLKKDLGFIL